MKVSKISIKDFHQFKDLEIDLTYPLGHKKAGQPLDKVCIIGQSGTGKTTLLKIIGGHTYNLTSLFKEYNPEEFEKVSVTRVAKNLEMEIRVIRKDIEGDGNGYSYQWKQFNENGNKINFDQAVKKLEAFKKEIKNQFIYFPAELRYNENESKGANLATKKIIDFGDYNLGDVWNIVLSRIQAYQESELKIRQELSKVAEDNSNDIEAIQKAVRKLERFKKEDNPLAEIADECLDPLLKHFNLRVKRELDIQKKEDLGFIKVEDLKGNAIPQSLLSTGTKQVIFSATPLFLLKPDGALILYDEPERSLYPSIQKFITDYYVSLTKNSQFFFATHSPIIASSFEPWEIVELKFNVKGEVYQEQYYPKTAERHVDNYTIIPSYLTYDMILNKVFDVIETHSNERSEKITEALMLRNQLTVMKEKDKLDSIAGKKVYAKYRDLANKLFWDFDII
jgi:ABC-type lipoprotein export system ATPase subunit